MATQTESKMKMLSIDFDFNQMGIVTEIVEINQSSDNLEDYYKIIDCDCIDIANLNQEIAIIVDDEGLLKSGNPVFEIKSNDGRKLQLAGKLIFAKNHYTDEGIQLVGLNAGELFKLMVDIKVSLIGVVR